MNKIPRFYRIRHNPTGYYYQPKKHKGGNFSKSGKIYQRDSGFFNDKVIIVRQCKHTRPYKETMETIPWQEDSGWNVCKFLSPISDWVKEYI